jgi:hypothetical protein
VAAEAHPGMGANGLMFEGIHEMTLSEVEATFGRFQRSDRRCRLFEKLRTYVHEVESAGWAASIILDGSFIMRLVDEPQDIDMILVLPRDWDMNSEVRPFEYNLLSKRMTRRLYGFDVFAVVAGSDAETKWLEFFAQVGPKWCEPFSSLPFGCKMGMVRIKI